MPLTQKDLAKQQRQLREERIRILKAQGPVSYKKALAQAWLWLPTTRKRLKYSIALSKIISNDWKMQRARKLAGTIYLREANFTFRIWAYRTLTQEEVNLVYEEWLRKRDSSENLANKVENYRTCHGESE